MSSPPHEKANLTNDRVGGVGYTRMQSVLLSISQKQKTISVLDRRSYLQTLSHLHPSRQIRQPFRGNLSWSWGILNFKAPCLYDPCLCECWDQLGAVECFRWRGVWLPSDQCSHLSTPGKLEKRSQKKRSWISKTRGICLDFFYLSS